jgi:ankyrin repeat protein
MRLLIKAGAHCDIENRNGISPLGHAAFAGDLEAVQAIIARGIPADPVSGQGLSALGQAASTGKRQSSMPTGLIWIKAPIPTLAESSGQAGAEPLADRSNHALRKETTS